MSSAASKTGSPRPLPANDGTTSPCVKHSASTAAAAADIPVAAADTAAEVHGR